MYLHLLNIKRQEIEKVYDLDSWSFIAIVLTNCSYFCVMSSSDDIRIVFKCDVQKSICSLQQKKKITHMYS